MATRQNAYLHNQRAQGIGLGGALLLTLASVYRIIALDPTSLDWVLVIGGITFILCWVMAIVYGRRIRRQELAGAGREGAG